MSPSDCLFKGTFFSRFSDPLYLPMWEGSSARGGLQLFNFCILCCMSYSSQKSVGQKKKRGGCIFSGELLSKFRGRNFNSLQGQCGQTWKLDPECFAAAQKVVETQLLIIEATGSLQRLSYMTLIYKPFLVPFSLILLFWIFLIK